MTFKSLKLVLVSTPVGYLGSGKGGGVELTLSSLVKGLLNLGHRIVLVAPEKSILPFESSRLEIKHVEGIEQSSWQHQEPDSPILIPPDGVLPRLWEHALEIGKSADAILNFSYDWLPIWLTSRVDLEIFHLISMGGVSQAMKEVVRDLSNRDHARLAFHSYAQASDYDLSEEPLVVGNGFDLNNYCFQPDKGGPLGWAGRVAPEKGLEDAAQVASALGDRLIVWGVVEDKDYADSVERCCSSGTIDWRGFLTTPELQIELGQCRALLNTPKWNEAYGNVVVEALACGVPVVAYNRGGPGELITSGLNGWLVPPDDVNALKEAVLRVEQISRRDCRLWVQDFASQDGFARRVLDWICQGIKVQYLASS